MCAAPPATLPNSTGSSPQSSPQPKFLQTTCRPRPDRTPGYLMKLLSFVADGRPSFGAVKDNSVVDLGARMAGCTTLRQLLEAGRIAEAARLVASTAADHPLERIIFAPVIPDPGKIIC